MALGLGLGGHCRVWGLPWERGNLLLYQVIVGGFPMVRCTQTLMTE